MAKYLLGTPEKEVVSVSRNSVFWMAECYLPDEVKETLSFIDCAKINGTWCMAFYADPPVGEIIQYKGHEWQVSARVQKVRKRSSREQGHIGLLRTTYLGLATPETE